MLKLIRKILKNKRGVSLIEAVLALGLLGLIATVFTMAIFISTKSIMIADERTNAESLARAQIEYIKQQEYEDGGLYAEILPPDGYEISYLTEDVEVGLQKITVEITHPGELEPILILEGYKVDAGVY